MVAAANEPPILLSFKPRQPLHDGHFLASSLLCHSFTAHKEPFRSPLGQSQLAVALQLQLKRVHHLMKPPIVASLRPKRPPHEGHFLASFSLCLSFMVHQQLSWEPTEATYLPCWVIPVVKPCGNHATHDGAIRPKTGCGHIPHFAWNMAAIIASRAQMLQAYTSIASAAGSPVEGRTARR